MTPTTHDVIVVGARVAGAATGMLLARAGLDVLLVDRAAYGSDILSTHALMRGGVYQLAHWGLLDEIVAAGTPPIRRTVMGYGGREEIVPIKPKYGVEALYAPRRTLLDRVLVDAACRAGADARFSCAVRALCRDGDRVTGIVARDRAGATFKATAPITIGADGMKSLVARAADSGACRWGRHAGGFLAAWYDGVEADGYQWLYGHAPDGSGRSAGIIPTNDGQVCAWVGMPGPLFRTRRPEDHFAELMALVAPEWVGPLAAGERLGPVRGFPGVPGYLRQAWGPGWALVGDAGCFKDPMSTHGMTEAFRDAELLARAVIAGAADPPSLETHLAGYERTRDELTLPIFETVDRLVSYSWSMEELRSLLIEMSAGMGRELAHLDELHRRAGAEPAPAPA